MAYISMNSTSLYARQVNSCSDPYQFYECLSFRGCCSINPCDDGNCPVENQLGGSSQTTASTTSTSVGQDQTVTVTASSSSTATSASTTSSSSRSSTATLTTTIGANTNVLTTTTVISTNISTNVSVETPTKTSPNNKAAIIGGSVGGILGAIALFLLIFWWCRKRRASKSAMNEKNPGFHENSEYFTSNSWRSEPYYQGHNGMQSPALSELDSSPVNNRYRAHNSGFPETVYELESVNGRTRASGSLTTTTYPSTSSRGSQLDFVRLGHGLRLSEINTISNESSAMGGGIRVSSSAGELSANPDRISA